VKEGYGGVRDGTKEFAGDVKKGYQK
jgi:hypothetical protein